MFRPYLTSFDILCRWNKKALLDRETVKVPLVGRLVEKLRRGNMLMTHLFMGGGKDPKPQP